MSAPRAATVEAPPTNRQTEPFWAALREHRLAMQECGSCGYVRWPAAMHCPQCLSTDAAWRDLDGHGTVWSIAIYEHAYDPGFRECLPYNVALVRLDEGPMLVSNIVTDDAPDERIVIGARVRAVFDDVSPELTLVRFARVSDDGGEP